MSTQYQLRPVELCDLPTLKRWRSLPSVQTHLRHPHLTWFQHLQWWWGIRSHTHPTCRVWAVTLDDCLVGVAGFYYRALDWAEVSVLVMDGDREDFVAEQIVLQSLLFPAAKAWGLRGVWAEVKGTAPVPRLQLFQWWRFVAATPTSTYYRLNLN